MFLNSLDWENKIQQANTIASENSNLPRWGGLAGIAQGLVPDAGNNLSKMSTLAGGGAGGSLFSRVMNTKSPLLGRAFGDKGSFPLSILGGSTRGGIMGLAQNVLPGLTAKASQGGSGPMSIMGALARTGAIPDLPPIQGAATGGQPVPIPVIPYDDQQGMAGQVTGDVDFTDINKQAQESTKELYPWWWKEHGPKGTGWFGPGEPEDLTN